ncbi:hypothetical protein N9383_06810 [Granulosicoccus sp.]|nr:hypothetical protein [Granulosicoccus sp.]
MNIKHKKIIGIASLAGTLCFSSVLFADEPQSTVSRTIVGTTKEFLSDPARTGSIVGSIIAGSALANPLAPLLGSVVGFVIGKSSAFSNKRGGPERANAYNNRSLTLDDSSEVTSLVGLSGASNLDTLPVDGVTVFEDLKAGSRTESTISLGSNENLVVDTDLVETPTLAAAQPELSDRPTGQIVIVESADRPNINSRIKPLLTTDIVREVDIELQAENINTQGLRVESAGATDVQKMLADACSNTNTVKPASLNCYYNAQ